jgi:hypothetical protein
VKTTYEYAGEERAVFYELNPSPIPAACCAGLCIGERPT